MGSLDEIIIDRRSISRTENIFERKEFKNESINANRPIVNKVENIPKNRMLGKLLKK